MEKTQPTASFHPSEQLPRAPGTTMVRSPLSRFLFPILPPPPLPTSIPLTRLIYSATPTLLYLLAYPKSQSSPCRRPKPRLPSGLPSSAPHALAFWVLGTYTSTRRTRSLTRSRISGFEARSCRQRHPFEGTEHPELSAQPDFLRCRPGQTHGEHPAWTSFASRPLGSVPGLKLYIKSYDHQAHAAAVAVESLNSPFKGIVIGDPPGLGKMVSCLSFLHPFNPRTSSFCRANQATQLNSIFHFSRCSSSLNHHLLLFIVRLCNRAALLNLLYVSRFLLVGRSLLTCRANRLSILSPLMAV